MVRWKGWMGQVKGIDGSGGEEGMGWVDGGDRLDGRSSLKEVGHVDGVDEINGINWMGVWMGCWVGWMGCMGWMELMRRVGSMDG